MPETKLFYTNEELPQRSEEWVKMRQSCIGASELGTILGLLVKYDNPKNIWKRKTGQLRPRKENKAVKQGEVREEEAKDAVAKHLEEVEGVKNANLVPYFAKHPSFDYIGVSFDAVDIENKFIVELKCPAYIWNFRTVFEDGIQDYYYPQVQLQLDVAHEIWGIDKAYFGSYFPDGAYILNQLEFKEYFKTLCVVDVDYCPEYCEAMKAVIKQYWKFVEHEYWDDDEYNASIDKFNDTIKQLK